MSVVVLAAAACDSVVITRACCHSLPFSVTDHRHASLLFCSGNAAGIVLGTLLPIPLKTLVCIEIDPQRRYTAPSATGSSKQQ